MSQDIAQASKPTYRPDIDGLRAVAILSVVFFHAFPTKLRGGFVGVDIFFVISGFLISSIIFKGLQSNSFSFTEFYTHRIKRIFPALILVLTASYTFGWFTLMPEEFKQLGKHIAAGVGFLQNFVLWDEAGYFDTASELKPLLHLWSLAIEEQFYLIYPLLIWGLWTVSLRLKPAVFFVAPLLGLLSFALNVHGIGQDAAKTFFLPHTRFWELLTGAVLAHLQLFKRVQVTEWLKQVIFHPIIFRHPPLAEKRDAVINNLLSIIGFLLIITSVIGLHRDKLFPGWWALAPVLGGALLIFADQDAWVNRRILSNRIMVFVGLISYPLYLWHWPILSFARIVESETPSRSIRMAAIILSFLLAWLTYRFFEKPIRFGQKSWIKTAVLCVLILIIGCTGYITSMRDGLVFRQIGKNKMAFTKALKWDGLWEDVNCKARYAMTPCMMSGNSPDVIIIGDSHANHLYPGLAAYKEHVFLQAGQYPPIEGVFLHAIKNNEMLSSESNDLLIKNLSIISSNEAIKTVILSAYWRLYLDRDFYNKRLNENTGGVKVVSKYPAEHDLSNPQIVLNGLKRTIKNLTSHGLRVIFVRDVFDITHDLSVYCKLNKHLTPENCTIPKTEFMQQRQYEENLVRFLKVFEPNLIIFDPLDEFCDQINCFLMRNGILYYRDEHHLSVPGSKLIAAALQKLL